MPDFLTGLTTWALCPDWLLNDQATHKGLF
jgi:hypothetical protein